MARARPWQRPWILIRRANFAGVERGERAAQTIDCTFTNHAKSADVSVKQEPANGGENGSVTFDVDYKVTATNSGSLDRHGALQVAPGFLGSDDRLGARPPRRTAWTTRPS